MNQKIKKRFIITKSKISVLVFSLYLFLAPVITFADKRTDAQDKLKTDGAAAINAFTNVFQYLGYIVAGLALVVIFLGSVVIHDEEAYRKAKRTATFTLIIAVLIGLAATIITIATNK